MLIFEFPGLPETHCRWDSMALDLERSTRVAMLRMQRVASFGRIAL